MEDYTAIIEARIKRAVLESYEASPQFQTDYNNLVTALGISLPNLNNFVNQSVSIGVSPQTAVDVWALTVINQV